MKIAVLTRWYNEAFFAPFFLGHYYSWADEIVVLLERTTTDDSAEICRRYKKVRVEWQDNGKELNDRVLSQMMSDVAASLNADWVVRVDADELVFPPEFEDPRKVLQRADGDVINALYRWVYRHKTDKPLDPAKVAVLQRIHGGDYTIFPGRGSKYTKPTIVRPRANIRWTPGEESFTNDPKTVKISSVMFHGAHWQLADVEQAVRRNEANNRRLSAENKSKGWGVKNFTEKMIRAECKRHENDPRVF